MTNNISRMYQPCGTTGKLSKNDAFWALPLVGGGAIYLWDRMRRKAKKEKEEKDGKDEYK